ncbi:MAG: GH1 family beta-glucosidase [Azospirillaceae bacterium]|nr:GH1 family beta-glucosidase [Azospirillaceae bacterium]
MSTFGSDFIWGTATSAYQIEGAVAEDGRLPSIWDDFSHQGGTVDGDDTGDVACDHYHRWRDDIALLKTLGVQAYRFSIAWPRVVPGGTGAVNDKGLDFYDRLVDALLAAGIEPFPTLYHWDLPQSLEDRGGWTNRDAAGWFTDYAEAVVNRLGRRVRRWTTFNEPNVFVIHGYGNGVHAPGRRDRTAMFQALNNVNRAHGLATTMMRAQGLGLQVGIVITMTTYRPARFNRACETAAQTLDTLWNRGFADPAILGHHAEGLRPWLEGIVQAGDEAAFAAPVDFLGLNHYFPDYVQADPDGLLGTASAGPPPGATVTDMNWEVDPGAFFDTMLMVRERYGDLPILVTENGCAYGTGPGADGQVHDSERIIYHRGYLDAAQQAIKAGVNLKGYFLWSLLDNFEWAAGYAKRFGIVHVDFATQKRTPKDSFDFYRHLIASHSL